MTKILLFISMSLVSDGVVSSLMQPRESRLSLAEPISSYNLRNIDGPGTYSFGYDIDDPETGNTQFREEQRYPNGTVAGSYGYVDADGNPVQVKYVADAKGYRVQLVSHKEYAWRSDNAISKYNVGNKQDQDLQNRIPLRNNQNKFNENNRNSHNDHPLGGDILEQESNRYPPNKNKVILIQKKPSEVPMIPEKNIYSYLYLNKEQNKKTSNDISQTGDKNYYKPNPLNVNINKYPSVDSIDTSLEKVIDVYKDKKGNKIKNKVNNKYNKYDEYSAAYNAGRYSQKSKIEKYSKGINKLGNNVEFDSDAENPIDKSNRDNPEISNAWDEAPIVIQVTPKSNEYYSDYKIKQRENN